TPTSGVPQPAPTPRSTPPPGLPRPRLLRDDRERVAAAAGGDGAAAVQGHPYVARHVLCSRGSGRRLRMRATAWVGEHARVMAGRALTCAAAFHVKLAEACSLRSATRPADAGPSEVPTRLARRYRCSPGIHPVSEGRRARAAAMLRRRRRTGTGAPGHRTPE